VYGTPSQLPPSADRAIAAAATIAVLAALVMNDATIGAATMAVVSWMSHVTEMKVRTASTENPLTSPRSRRPGCGRGFTPEV
jgi:hypothetical protein